MIVLVVIDQDVIEEVECIVCVIVEVVSFLGVLGVEMFLIKIGGLYVNELVFCFYNFGYYFIEVCFMSQFDVYI